MLIENFETYYTSYNGISSLLKTFCLKDILESVAHSLRTDIHSLSNYPMGGNSKGKTNGCYLFVLKDLIKNISRYDTVFEMLADNTSKLVFTRLMQFRLIPDMRFVQAAYDKEHPQYFDKTLVHCTKDEVFVDCGGFTGDTVEEYIRQYEQYKTIYVYEPSNDNIEHCRSNTSKYPNIILRNCGVGEKSEALPISNSMSSSSFTGTVEDGDLIPIVSLDEDIKEKITFIKMDVEGFEIPALLGAKNHIKNDTPKLAICTYHILSDMWEIPLLIHSINPNYSYYFRHYNPDQNLETVVYAIPKTQTKLPAAPKQQYKALAIPHDFGWRNVELTKDCGLIPYLLYKNHSMDVTMLGAAREAYPYLDTYVKGLHMELLPTGSEYEKNQYILQHGTEYDCLILRGPYDSNIDVAVNYKKVNPTGKIYMGLDANSYWMDGILWDTKRFRSLLDSCDVIATSCHAMQKHLNEKWPWKIEYIPNGFYSWSETITPPDFNKKENIILTVGRLGTVEKATDLLLEAFALIADKIPDWSLRLVGSIEESFQPYMDSYFQMHPQLRNRITFAGMISDKNALFAEYVKAKIFTLTSPQEGGTPNVIAEALLGGCAIAVTKFDAWEDAIDNGRCGMAAERDNISDIANMLLSLCRSNKLEQFSDHAYQYALRNFDMNHIVSKIYELLYGGESTWLK